jgi:hypothetical protein
MPDKLICKECLFYVGEPHIRRGFCTQQQVRETAPAGTGFFTCSDGLPLIIKLATARDICDRELDGHFTLFTPKPVQITRETPQEMRAAA